MSHSYAVTVTWEGNRGTGTSHYTAYDRAHAITAPGKPPIPGSADPAFRGDPARWNPEELLLASVAACHKLWYLHLAAEAGITVTAYEDRATGTLTLAPDGSGRFTAITLAPRVTIASGDPAAAEALHAEANRFCFIAASLDLPVHHAPRTRIDGTATPAT